MPYPTDPLDRFMSKVREDGNGCWIWLGYIDNKGYPRFGLAPSKPVRAHKWIYELLYGPQEIVHHICEVKVCVNPDHLAGTDVEGHGIHHRKGFCKRGHKMDEENVYVDPSWGLRSCKRCRLLRGADYKKGGDAQ